MLLCHAIRSNAGLGRYERLSRDLDAHTAPVVFHSVIHAPHVVAFDSSQRQGCGAVAATIFEGNQLTVGSAVENDGFADYGDGK
jgi:hypothetical protein